MPNFATPGCYIQEVSKGAKPVTMVSTTTAAFVGQAPNQKARPNEAVACNNWSQFVKEFVSEGCEDTHLSLSVRNFFNNGGSRCYVVNMSGDIESALRVLGKIDEIAIVAAPGMCDATSYQAVIDHCENLGDRFAILDAPLDVPDIDALKTVATASSKSRSRGAKDDEAQTETTPSNRAIGLRCSDSKNAAYYFPWIETQLPLSRSTGYAPPSGFIAGIYARTDSTRGVHKPPANEMVRGATGLSYRLSHAEQGELNNRGVCCIRFFPNSGIVVWGARTVSSDPEWRYINVRRLFLMVEESIVQSTQWVVFEPNDENLQKAVVRDISAFLTLLWRDGALRGSTPEQAFYVKCDDETNPPEVVDAGQLVVEIGLACVKPAEFIIFRIGQYTGGSAEVTESTAEA